MPGPRAKRAPHSMALQLTEFKALDDERGEFEGYLAVFGNVDAHGDVIEPGAFKKTIRDAEAQRRATGAEYLLPILWQHDPLEPIGGFVEMREDTKGLYVRGRLDMDIPQGRRAYSGLKKGYLRGLSIGYDTIREEWRDNRRHLKEIRLWEGSVVTFPANPLATVTATKALEFDDELQTINLMSRWWNLFETLQRVIRSILEDPLITEKIQAIAEALDGFRAAVLEWAEDAVAAELWTSEKKMAGLVRETKEAEPDGQTADRNMELAKIAAALRDAASHLEALVSEKEPDSAEGATPDTTPADQEPKPEEPGPDPSSATTPAGTEELQALIREMRETLETLKGVE